MTKKQLKALRDYVSEQARVADANSKEWCRVFGDKTNTAYLSGMWYAYNDILNRLPTFKGGCEVTKKKDILKHFPEAYCVRLNDQSGFVVWPGKIQPRGFERPVIGYGITAQKAWSSIRIIKRHKEGK